MTSVYGFETEHEKREAERQAKKVEAERLDALDTAARERAKKTFSGVCAKVNLVLMDFLQAREVIDVVVFTEPFSLTCVGRARANTPNSQRVEIRVHVPLDRTECLNVLTPYNWAKIYKEDLSGLAQVLANECEMQVCTTFYQRAQGPFDDIPIVSGEQFLKAFFPRRV
ncbi:MAG: hypothetical protein UZ21_OP11001000263 [Microgenomates bacterium OLB22]|nr:MAG: hypothetical protein UZ21_OP11001000263 [Microgenomates bacterium OLB22]